MSATFTVTQARREGGVEAKGGKLSQTPWRLGGIAIGKKYKVRQNAPFQKEKFKKFLHRMAPWKCLGPHENVSLGPAVALDGPAVTCAST